MPAWSNPETIQKAALGICFVICANLIADLTSLVLEKYLPVPPVSRLASRRSSAGTSGLAPRFDVIADRNLFSSKTPKGDRGGIDMEAEPVPTSLSYQLVGTVIFRNPSRSLAAIQDKGANKLYPVRIGDMIGDSVQIISVEARKVIFINQAARRKEYIDIPEDSSIKISTTGPLVSRGGSAGGIQQTDENRFVVSRQEIDAQLANFNALLTQARALPEQRGGQMIGFRLTEIKPGSFYQKVGLRDGDILKGVNGEKITDPAKGFELLQGLKSMSALDIMIERGGKDVTFNYDFR
jgi:type II secretion system protein C